MAIRVATPIPLSIIEKNKKAKDEKTKKDNIPESSKWRFYLRYNKLR